MKYLASGLIVLIAAVALVGCGGAKSAKTSGYGKPIPADMAVVTAREILDSPAAYEGKEVLVAGTVTSECPSGGWVWVKDETGSIYVNMHPTNVFIPQHVKGRVRALGKVVLEFGQPQVVGYGLELR